MKRLLSALLVSLAFCLPAHAQERTSTGFINPLGYCQLTSVSSSTLVSSCSGGIPARTAWAVLCVDTAAIRWRDDGTAPTASVGMPVAAGQCFYYSGTFSTLRVIAQTGSPVVNISFYSGAPRQ
jgi:hypothetical protein